LLKKLQQDLTKVKRIVENWVVIQVILVENEDNYSLRNGLVDLNVFLNYFFISLFFFFAFVAFCVFSIDWMQIIGMANIFFIWSKRRIFHRI
jgi:hypothetical protein